jgi:glycosyltransferase involved in cell wall biosynthesis
MINKEKVKIISCALDKTIFKTSKQKTVFNKNLLFVGRLVPRKNIHDLIKITKLLVNTDKGYILNIVGEGEYTYVEKIKKEIKINNLQNNIIFHGKVTDAELNRQYKSNSIFVFTSLVEGFGLVLLEAMSKGLPVIAYDVNGVRDVIIDNVNGYLIKPFNYQEFNNKILNLNRNNRIYQQMSRNALKRVNDFNWDTSVQKIINGIK